MILRSPPAGELLLPPPLPPVDPEPLLQAVRARAAAAVIAARDAKRPVGPVFEYDLGTRYPVGLFPVYQMPDHVVGAPVFRITGTLGPIG